MGTYSFKLPDLGEGIVESEVSAWHVQGGDTVEEDQVRADVRTDKAIVEVGSPVSGTIVALGCEAGDVLAVGAELVRFELDGQAGDAAPAQAETGITGSRAGDSAKTAKRDSAGASTSQQRSAGGISRVTGGASNVLASPSLRRRAREEEIDLAAVPGSGPQGRISHADLDAFIAAGGELAMRVGGRASREGRTEIKVTGLRRVIARKMQQTMRDIPHYSYIEEVDVTQLEALRVMLNENKLESQPRLTLLPFLAQALVKVLPQFPHCNARFDDETGVLTQFDAVHLGVATMTAAGLMVPVLRHCESLDLWQCAAGIARVSQVARDNTAAAAELSGSTITITSLGAIGGIATTPVINAPETAIIGVNKMQQRPVVIDGAIVVRTMMNVSASFDHRIVDGYDGAQLVQALKRVLENPGAIFV
jgi:2-oxoisovalerate dehydrogenase E2 component (dihydrolipoyl transacylase)